MFTFIKEKLRRIRQKVLFEQIFEFLDSKYCTGDRSQHARWLLEMVCFTPAKEAYFVADCELQEMYKHVLKTRTPFTVEEAARCVRKFFRYCKMKKYIYYLPWDLEIDDKDAIIESMKKIIKRKTGPMPDINLIVRIRKMYDEGKKNGDKISFQKIADILNKELHKNLDRQQVCRYYYNPRVVF